MRKSSQRRSVRKTDRNAIREQAQETAVTEAKPRRRKDAEGESGRAKGACPRVREGTGQKEGSPPTGGRKEKTTKNHRFLELKGVLRVAS